jgi:hypothetical protein
MPDASLLPESRRTVDPLVSALHRVISELSPGDRGLVLEAIDARLADVAPARRRVALDALRRCAAETDNEVSKRRYETWRADHPDRESLPSSTYVSNSFNGSWAQAMDAAGFRPSARHHVHRYFHLGPSPTDEELLTELRRCGEALGPTFTFEEYREWALVERKRDPSRRGLLISPQVYARRFGSLARARTLVGLPPVSSQRGPRGRRSEYTADKLIAAIRQAARELGRVPTTHGYEQWRTKRLEAARRRGDHILIPSWAVCHDRFFGWPRALAAAGLITGEQTSTWARGKGQLMPAQVMARTLLLANDKLAGDLSTKRFALWRAKRLQLYPASRLASTTAITRRFGSWTLARVEVEKALALSDPAAALEAAIIAISGRD